MSFRDCVEDAVRGGVLTREAAEELYARAQSYEAEFRLDLQHSPESAARLGQDAAIKNAKRQTRLARYQAAKQAIINTVNVANVRSHPAGTAKGIAALLGRDIRGQANYGNVDFRRKAILGQAHATFAEGLSDLRTRLFGLSHDKELLRNVMRELHGEKTGIDQAAGIAKMWTETAENLRQRFNRAGGAIARRSDWGSPQSHDSGLVASASPQEWIDFVMPRLQRDAITSEAGVPLGRDELKLLLEDINQAIRTDGVSRLVPGQGRGAKLANRRQQHRVLVFKDADAWLEYAERFGKPDMFKTMMEHIDSMAHDIALLEVLGPNPNAGFRMLEDVARIDNAGKFELQYNESLFRTVNGSVERNSSVRMADFTDSVASWLVAAKLGSAAISAVSDVGFVGATARWNGLSFTRVMSEMLRQLDPSNEVDRIFATKLGLTAMQWSNAMLTANRYSNVRGHGASGKAAEVTLRASGLTAWTDAWKRAFGMEFFGNLGDHLSRTIDEMPENLGVALRRYNITDDEWDKIRATAPLEHDGAKFVSIESILAREDLPIGERETLDNKLQEMVLTEMNFAVPEPDARVRAITSGALFGSGARGTPSGIFARLSFQFKGFPLSAISFHVFRAINAKGGPISPLSYAAQVLISTTLLGGLALQLKEISRGKNPRPINDARFWGAALVQGGGLGIYGDFLFNDVNRFGGGLTSTATGPFVDLIDDTAKLTLGQLWDLGAGRDMNVISDVVNYARKYAPGGSLWYARLIFEREVLDQLQLLGDREAPVKFKRRMRSRERRYDQTYWWRMGETTPREPPQLEELIQ